jgi:hypothetical protein
MYDKKWYDNLVERRLGEIQNMTERLQNRQDTKFLYPLPFDHLISLVYYNVYRALVANVEMLGLDVNLMYTDDYPSPFTPLSPSASSAIRRLPPTLQPTVLQQTMAHHPQWDALPDPIVRDNILRYGEENIDDYDFCFDLIGMGDFHDTEEVRYSNEAGWMVWDDPWKVTGWEVTEHFARKWWFLLRGAHNVQNSTNYWRRQRGEGPLDFHQICEIG